jgi:hypothetical protein
MEVIGSSWKGEMVYIQIFNENSKKNLHAFGTYKYKKWSELELDSTRDDYDVLMLLVL